jgi:aspartyl aminopeptidase
VDFLSRCKTERETVEFVRGQLRAAGFVESLTGDFKGDAVFRIARGKTLFAARKGKLPLSAGFRLIGAHADSPRLDFKQRPLYQECAVAQAKTHYYGGIRKHQWLARPLALHGVVVKTDGTVLPVCIGEDPADPVFAISDLLPHLAYKQVEMKLSEAFEAEKLNIILGHAPAADGKKAEKGKKNGNNLVKRKVLELLHKRYGVTEEDLYSAELQAVPAGPARRVGLDGGIVGGYGQDDRICVYAALSALLAAPRPEHARWCCSGTRRRSLGGLHRAKSHFFEYCLEDVIAAWEPRAKPRRVYEKSRALSADVHAAMDPDYQDLHEKLNAALLGMARSFASSPGIGARSGPTTRTRNT